jgi:hypothetical protein
MILPFFAPNASFSSVEAIASFPVAFKPLHFEAIKRLCASKQLIVKRWATLSLLFKELKQLCRFDT